MSGPFDPYYDYSPRRLLRKPLALCGYYGSSVVDLAFSLSTQTALPLHDIERLIEHRIGARIAHSQTSIHEIETTILTQALQQQPYGIIALRPQSLSTPQNRQLILDHSDSLYIQRDIFILYGNLLEDRSKGDKSRFCHLPSPINITGFQQDFNQYKTTYQKLNHTIHAFNKHPSLLCDAVFSFLDASA